MTRKPVPAGRQATVRPVLAALVALVFTALSVAGCVSMPSGGPVQSYPMTQGTSAQSQPYVQLQPQPPGPGWDPQQIVQGFLAASASFGNYAKVAQQYLTPQEQKTWKNSWSAIVYKSGPNVAPPSYSPAAAKNPTQASVQINGTIQASLRGSGSYSVPSASAQGEVPYGPDPFLLQKLHGQWRISSAPQELLLTSNAFNNDYQLRNLYFFDPESRYLVPDPVYVPLEATNLMNGLVSDLITPPTDWLGTAKTKAEGATKTAFPAGTKLSGVTLNGATAVVNLTGTIVKAKTTTLQQISAQLLSTLSGAVQGGLNGQAVQSIEVQLNGKPWIPPGGQGNPVQQPSQQPHLYSTPTGASTTYYYVDSSGYLTSRSVAGGPPHRFTKIGTGYSPIAVSPDGSHVAALRGDTLYAGILGDPLVKRGSGYSSISWDVDGDLWVTAGNRIVMFHGSADPRQPLGQMVTVNVVPSSSQLPLLPPYTDIKVAPDGVRVAIVMENSYLTFGAISGRLGPDPQISLSTVEYQPAPPAQSTTRLGNFTALSWYGAGDVITLATPGSVVTEYPVSGGTSTPISADPGMQTIAASSGQPLLAGLPKEQLASDANTTGSWLPLTDNNGAPVNGSSPTYPG